MNRKDLHDILDVCLDINEFTSRAAFFAFAGHCDLLDVRVCAGKDKGDDENDPEYNQRIYDVTFWGTDNIGSQVAEDLMTLYNRERELEELDDE